MPSFVRFENVRTDALSQTFGPYAFVQLTYNLLRIVPDGVELAYFDGEDWTLFVDENSHWTDVIIYGEPDA